jgi:hypothetical protein
MITLGLRGTVERIEGDDAYCSVTDDTFRFIYETGHLERLSAPYLVPMGSR